MSLIVGPWSERDLADLIAMFDDGMNLSSLSMCLRRTASSVGNKLTDQGKLVFIGGNYIKPWADVTEINRVNAIMKEKL